jgi:ABC-2 type transport system permease protein
VSARVTLATALRVLRQLRRDPRTLALVFVVPPLLITLFRYVFDGRPLTFDRVGAPMVGIFPFVSMFVVTSIAMLRERTTGTLERLMTMPLAKIDLLAGYGLAFALVATVQASITSAVALGLLGLDVQGPVWVVILLAVANAVLGMSIGLFTSAFARTEFQAVQFLPATVFPQLLLCGLIVPRDRMQRVLERASNVLPLTWAYDALDHAAVRGEVGGVVLRDALIVVGATLLALALGATTLRRRTP